MYKVLIVDECFKRQEDNYIHLEWKKYDLSVCDKVVTKDAYKAIKFHNPDIIILNNNYYEEILDVLNETGNSSINAEFIIVSSYDNIQVINERYSGKKLYFLFNPCNSLNIIKEVLIVKKDLEDKNNEDNISVFRKNIPIVKESILREMLHGNIDDFNGIMEIIKLYTINIIKSPIVTTIIDIDDEFEANKLNETLDTLKDYIYRQFSSYKHYEVVKDKNVLLLVVCVEEGITYDEILNDCKLIKDKIKIYFDTSVTMAVGKIFNSLSELSKSYKSAKSVLEFKMIYGDGQVISTKNVRTYLAELDFYPVDETKDIIDSFKANDEEGIYKNVDRFYSSLINNGALSKIHIQEATNRLLGTICKKCLGNSSIKSKYYNKIIVYERILKCNTIDKIKCEVNGFLKEIKRQTSFHTDNELIKSVILYIDKNYSDTELSLAKVADEIFITPVYLSKLFKQETGVNFLDFIHKVRIDKAKNYLLDSNIKVYEVSLLVGYSNEKHFSKKFKKYVGKSPSEYRQDNV